MSVAALGVGSTLWVVPPAGALSFSPCDFNLNAGCARVSVPLDRSGSVAGSVSLQVERFATAPRGGGVLLAIAGGPGQSATAVFDEPYLNALGAALSTHDFVTLDLRGAGRSDALRCPALDAAGPTRVTVVAAACAAALGPRRAFYTTADAVADIEAVRVALGVPRMALYGISYGSKVALAYAMAHPDHVERVVLDSIVGPDGPDPVYRTTFLALPRVLRALCRDAACRGITSNPVRDLATVATRLRRRALRGYVVDGGGRRRRAVLRAANLFELLLSGDLQGPVRAALPAALRSAVRGDSAPLLRLAGPAAASNAPAAPFEADSRALFAASTCEEAPLPWDRTAALDARPAQAATRLASLPPSTFAPLDAATMLATGDLLTCLRWPETALAPVLSGSPPPVPALLLEGESDLRTPVEGAQRVSATLPAATLLVSPATGHGVLPNPPACVKRALAQFFAAQPVTARCVFGPPPPHLRPLAVAPRSLGAVAPASGVGGRSGRTLAAVGLTLADIAGQVSSFALSPRSSVGGLRGGSVRMGADGRISLRRTEYVPGVSVDGRLGAPGGTLVVGGRAAAPGRLLISRGGAVRGVLGGFAVHGRIGRALLTLLP
jgi:pimeloyl-ACP methyl ester carboxylesterase